MTAANYAGEWHTDFGGLVLTIDGSRVTGTYGPNAGRVEGVLTGNTVRGGWRQSAPCAGGVTWGTFDLTFSGDGRSFTCRWQYQDHLAPGWGNWYGRRQPITTSEGAVIPPTVTTRAVTVSRRTPPAGGPVSAASARLLGKWDTDHGELDLQVVGNRVTATYGRNAGQLEGVIVSGDRIQGTWRQCAPCVLGVTWGTFTLTLNADGKSFTCQWHYADQYAPGWGYWYGSRQTVT